MLDDSIRFSCPRCGVSLKARKSKAGSKFFCQSCGQRIQVPAPQTNKTMLGKLDGEDDYDVAIVPIASPYHAPVPKPSDPFDFQSPDPHQHLPQYQQQPIFGYAHREPHRGTAVLVMGIIALFTLPIILGPIAWGWANEDLRKMALGQMDPEGRGNTQAGKICGIIATIEGIAIVGVILMYFTCCGILLSPVLAPRHF